jgi:actin-related protein
MLFTLCRSQLYVRGPGKAGKDETIFDIWTPLFLPESESMNNFYILDNGSYSIKAGYSTDETCSIHPNSSSKPKYEKKTYFGNLDACRNLSGLVQSRPFERYNLCSYLKSGYLTNWGLQKDILDTVLPLEDLANLNLLITEPMFNLPNIQQSYEEVLFEEYGVASLLRSTSAQFATALLEPRRDCCIGTFDSFNR